jgi:ribosome-binding ATPase YchF (GTP1/OBG family)
VEGKVDPLADIETINTELILADLQTVDNRLPKLEKEAKRNPELADQLVAVTKARELLNAGRTIISAANEVDLEQLRDLHLLTAKPFLYVFNVDESGLENTTRHAELADLIAPAPAIVLCAQLESDLVGLEGDDLTDMLSSYGLEEPGLDRLIRLGFETLGL